MTAHNGRPYLGTINVGLAEAADASDLVFTTGGIAPWFRQTTVYHDDGDAGQSGDVSHNQESWMQTTVTGPGTVQYWWKVSSQGNRDYLEFYIDGRLQSGRVSGTVDWQARTHALGSGAHTLKWRYTKDGSGDSGSDCGWVDKIQWTGPPMIRWFAINDGDGSAATRDVTLGNLCSCSPTHYMASEAPGFTGASWQPYLTAPSLTASSGEGGKTVYFKVKNSLGESLPATDTIVMGPAIVFEDAFASKTIDRTQWTQVSNASVDDVGMNEPSPPDSLRLNGDPVGGDSVESRSIDLTPYSGGTLTYWYQRAGG